jgi:hypothetical protein
LARASIRSTARSLTRREKRVRSMNTSSRARFDHDETIVQRPGRELQSEVSFVRPAAQDMTVFALMVRTDHADRCHHGDRGSPHCHRLRGGEVCVPRPCSVGSVHGRVKDPSAGRARCMVPRIGEARRDDEVPSPECHCRNQRLPIAARNGDESTASRKD